MLDIIDIKVYMLVSNNVHYIFRVSIVEYTFTEMVHEMIRFIQTMLSLLCGWFIQATVFIDIGHLKKKIELELVQVAF